MRHKWTINPWALLRPICWATKHDGEYVIGIDTLSYWLCKRCLAKWTPCFLQAYDSKSKMWMRCAAHGMILGKSEDDFLKHAELHRAEFTAHWKTRANRSTTST